MKFINDTFFWLLDRKNVRKSVFFWPLIVEIGIVFLAAAYDNAQSEMVRKWIESILIPIVDLAPLFVSIGESILKLLVGFFLIAWFLYLLIHDNLSKNRKTKYLRILWAAVLAIVGISGWLGAFALPAQPGAIDCFRHKNCPNPDEAILLSICMMAYPLTSIGLLVGVKWEKKFLKKKTAGRKKK